MAERRDIDPVLGKALGVLGHAEVFEPYAISSIAAPLRRINLSPDRLRIESGRQVFPANPGMVHRGTKQARQVSSAPLRCTESTANGRDGSKDLFERALALQLFIEERLHRNK